MRCKGWRSKGHLGEMVGRNQGAGSCRVTHLWAASRIRVGTFLGWSPYRFLFPRLVLVPRPLVFPWWGWCGCCARAGHVGDPSHFVCSSWLRPVKGPAEELRQAATGCPPVSEEPDQPGEEVLLRPVSLSASSVHCSGAVGHRARGQFSLAGND